MEPRRRALSALIAAAAVPGIALGQRARTIGYFSGGSDGSDFAARLAPLGHAVRFVVRKEPASTGGALDPAYFDAVAAELVAARPDVLLALFHYRVAALFAATKTIPIVCGLTGDPVGAGFAKTLQRPGGNVTGLSGGGPESFEMALGALRLLRPRLDSLVFVQPPDYRGWTDRARALEAISARAGLATRRVPVRNAAELDAALAAVRDVEREAAYLWPLFTVVRPEELGAICLRHKVATHCFDVRPVEHGALLSCKLVWDDSQRMERTVAILDKVLRGTPPGTIPFELPSRVDYVFNRAAALRIGVGVPAEILLRATKVIG